MRVIIALSLIIAFIVGIFVFSVSSSNKNDTFQLDGFWAAENRNCENYNVLIQFINGKIFRQSSNGKRAVWGENYTTEYSSKTLKIFVETRIGIEEIVFEIVSNKKLRLLAFSSNEQNPTSLQKAKNFFTLNKCN